MAGRGRGRGRGHAFNLEALGLGRGEVLPSIAQPPPLYPPLVFKPVPFTRNEDLDYMLALKQELRHQSQKLPFYIKAPNKVRDIERYSDKYQLGSSDGANSMQIDWSRFPTELREIKKRKKLHGHLKPNLKGTKNKAPDVSTLLERLEKNDVKEDGHDEAEEEAAEGEEEKEGKENEGDDEEDEEYDEEDFEEDNDYSLPYFDNGEGYGDDDEDVDEGPTY